MKLREPQLRNGGWCIRSGCKNWTGHASQNCESHRSVKCPSCGKETVTFKPQFKPEIVCKTKSCKAKAGI